jgi:hypothetical protein
MTILFSAFPLPLIHAGQLEGLQAALEYREKLMEETIARAEEQGVQLAFEDDEEMNEDEESE